MFGRNGIGYGMTEMHYAMSNGDRWRARVRNKMQRSESELATDDRRHALALNVSPDRRDDGYAKRRAISKEAAIVACVRV